MCHTKELLTESSGLCRDSMDHCYGAICVMANSASISTILNLILELSTIELCATFRKISIGSPKLVCLVLGSNIRKQLWATK